MRSSPPSTKGEAGEGGEEELIGYVCLGLNQERMQREARDFLALDGPVHVPALGPRFYLLCSTGFRVLRS